TISRSFATSTALPRTIRASRAPGAHLARAGAPGSDGRGVGPRGRSHAPAAARRPEAARPRSPQRDRSQAGSAALPAAAAGRASAEAGAGARPGVDAGAGDRSQAGAPERGEGTMTRRSLSALLLLGVIVTVADLHVAWGQQQPPPAIEGLDKLSPEERALA